MVAFFIAGQETVAHVITFALCHLMRDEVLLKKAMQEAEAFLEEPCYEKTSDMEVSEMILKETLRLYAPVPGLRRVFTENYRLGDYEIPKGTLFVHTMKLYSHNPAIWGDDHLEFQPERFKATDEMSKSRHPHAFLPFGIGPRVCLGREVAKVEFKVILSYLLVHFNFVPVETESIKMVRHMSVKPKEGYNCYIYRRK